METELNVNFFPEVIVTRPPITNGKDTEKNLSDDQRISRKYKKDGINQEVE